MFHNINENEVNLKIKDSWTGLNLFVAYMSHTKMKVFGIWNVKIGHYYLKPSNVHARENDTNTKKKDS